MNPSVSKHLLKEAVQSDLESEDLDEIFLFLLGSTNPVELVT